MSDGAPDPRDDAETTQIRPAGLSPRRPSHEPAGWVHSLRVVEGHDTGRRVRVGADALSIGRRADNGLALPDAEVSGQHCSVRALPGHSWLEVLDLDSTNGTYVDGRLVQGSGRLRDRALLQIGRHVLLHEFLPRLEMERAEQTDRDLERARHYVMALLPPPITEGPVRSEWFFRPSAMLGGDAFGMLAVDAQRIAGYMIDVSGHGAGVAMHTVSVLNVLRQRALPDTDFADPGQVLTRLNAMFQMAEHDGLFFTLWYGVYDSATRELAFASAGHHPAYLRQPGQPGPSGPAGHPGLPGQPGLQALATRQLAIGVTPDLSYRADRVDVAPGARLYIFSDGLFEFTGRDGRQHGLADLLPLIGASDTAPGEPDRLYAEVRRRAGDAPLEDDCSIVTVTFL